MPISQMRSYSQGQCLLDLELEPKAMLLALMSPQHPKGTHMPVLQFRRAHIHAPPADPHGLAFLVTSLGKGLRWLEPEAVAS